MHSIVNTAPKKPDDKIYVDMAPTAFRNAMERLFINVSGNPDGKLTEEEKKIFLS